VKRLLLLFFLLTLSVASATERKVVAVLPFTNLTHDETTAWLSEAIPATLTSKLGRVSALELVPRVRMNEFFSIIELQHTST